MFLLNKNPVSDKGGRASAWRRNLLSTDSFPSGLFLADDFPSDQFPDSAAYGIRYAGIKCLRQDIVFI